MTKYLFTIIPVASYKIGQFIALFFINFEFHFLDLIFFFSFFFFPVVPLLDDMGASGTCSYMLRHSPIPMGLPLVPHHVFTACR
jgi:hypothetical protein